MCCQSFAPPMHPAKHKIAPKLKSCRLCPGPTCPCMRCCCCCCCVIAWGVTCVLVCVRTCCLQPLSHSLFLLSVPDPLPRCLSLSSFSVTFRLPLCPSPSQLQQSPQSWRTSLSLSLSLYQSLSLSQPLSLPLSRLTSERSQPAYFSRSLWFNLLWQNVQFACKVRPGAGASALPPSEEDVPYGERKEVRGRRPGKGEEGVAACAYIWLRHAQRLQGGPAQCCAGRTAWCGLG